MFTDISEEAARSRYRQWRNQSWKRLLTAKGSWARRDSFNLPRFFHVKPSNLSMFFATVLPRVVVSGTSQLPIPRNQFEEWEKEKEKREVDGGGYSGLFKKKFVSDNTLYATIATSMRRVSRNSYETKKRCEFHENRLKVRSLCFSSFSLSSSFLLLHPRASFSWQLSTRRVEKYFPTDFRRDYGKTFSASSFASSSFVPPSSSVFFASWFSSSSSTVKCAGPEEEMQRADV